MLRASATGTVALPDPKGDKGELEAKKAENYEPRSRRAEEARAGALFGNLGCNAIGSLADQGALKRRPAISGVGDARSTWTPKSCDKVPAQYGPITNNTRES
jgi:hypothetical protein